MKDLYSMAGISKQALHKHRQREIYKEQVARQVVENCKEIRKDHGRMSCRKMYHKVREQVPVGRDLFVQIGFENGFKLHPVRSKIKTTWATRLEVYPNLLEGQELNGINQAWQSDIFYISADRDHYYGVTIIDVYSRRLLALHISNSLMAEQVVKAVKKAIQQRMGHDLEGCIFHSDRGSQYIGQLQKNLLFKKGFEPSMAKLPQENAYAERVQGTVKNEYLESRTLTKENIRSEFRKIQRLYNYDRPHDNLGKKTPIEFEKYINTLKPEQRPKLIVNKWVHPILTKVPVINKKEKRSKKEKTYIN